MITPVAPAACANCRFDERAGAALDERDLAGDARVIGLRAAG